MLRYYKHIVAILIVALMLPVVALTQGPPPRHGRGDKGKPNREKMQQMKKMKMLEILDLSKEVSDKFLLLYNQHERDIDKAFQNMRDNSQELKIELDKNPGSAKAVTLADKIAHSKIELGMLDDQFAKDMKVLLPAEKYTKFVYFEANFEHEVMRAMWEQRKKGHNVNMLDQTK